MSEINIVNIISSRLKLMAISQAQTAGKIGATPAQFGLFLKEKGNLSVKSLNKCFELTGIDLSIYENRNVLAKEVAKILRNKQVVNIDNWSKEELIGFTGKKELELFFDVKDEDYYQRIVDSGCVDYESTFPFIKALIGYNLAINDGNLTSSAARQALERIMPPSVLEEVKCDIDKSDNVFGVGAVIGSAVVALAGWTLFKQFGASTLFSKTSKLSLNTKALFNLKK